MEQKQFAALMTLIVPQVIALIAVVCVGLSLLSQLGVFGR